MVSLVVHEAHPHDAFKPIARLDSTAMRSIGASDGDILEIVGKRRTIVKCMLLDEGGDGSAWMTHTVRNNAEVPVGGRVEVKKIEKVADAKKLVLLSSHNTEISKHMENLDITQHLSAMLAGFPVLMQDYLVSFDMMGHGWIVFQVVAAEPDGLSARDMDSGIPLIVRKRTAIEVIKGGEASLADKPGITMRRSYPVFWVSFQETLRKMDPENVFLVVTFYGLHSDGHISGQLEKKITKDTDIQSLTSQFRDIGLKTMDLINEEARTKKISPTDVQNRILQQWMAV